MARLFLLTSAVALVLLACTPGQVTAPSRGAFGSELVRLRGDGPPKGPEGACWANATTPAVIETLTEQELVSPEVRDDAGRVVAPATFRTSTHQRMVQDREVVWFRVPCPDVVTVAFVATLQRALKARGLYLLPVTGAMDAATAEAIRRFQAERGLDSPTLSLAAARELGISTTDLDKL